MATMDDNPKIPFRKYREMHPLEMLAAVASETLENEKIVDKTVPKGRIVSSKTKFNLTASTLKKAPLQSDQLTLKEIRSLSEKMLVEKFSEMTADELSKKYSYKCCLLPKSCFITFKSYGNETKARAQMKTHLTYHLEQLSANNVNSKEKETLFTARSSMLVTKKKKSQEKSRKKKVDLNKKLQDSLKNDLALILNKPTKFLKTITQPQRVVNNKARSLPLKTTKVKVNSYVPKYKKNNHNNPFNVKSPLFKSEKIKPVNKPEVLYNCDSKSDVCDTDEKSTASKSDDEIESSLTEEILSYYQRSSSFNFHLEQSHSIPVDKIIEDGYDAVNNNQEPKVFLHDHTYMISNKGKSDVASIPECTATKAKPKREVKCASFLKDLQVAKQFIIETPPFPFVYTPVLPHIAQIAELGNPFGTGKTENENEPNDNDILIKVEEDDIQDIDLSASVLECVENTVNLTEPDDEALKNTFPVIEDSDENSIVSTQLVEKQLALKYIRTLRMKKKDELGSLTCQICKNKHFTAQATLMHHYRSHAGIKPYTCDICCATFTRQHSLNYHMLIHNNLSRFSCDDCGRMFRHPSHYKEHLRRHTGETPFHCLECHLQFKTRNTYKRHLKTRHGKLLTAQGIKQLSAEEFLTMRNNSKLSKDKQHIL